MKKSLALVLALVMVLGSFSFVSAAPDFADVKGTVYEEAVGRLELLNVLKGYPDGSFQPNGMITRAEFAAVAVRARGLENVAMAAKGLPTGFTDVPANHWASGYVGTAASMGIVRGIGNGLFAPAAPVRYEEAVTMLVRALGYDSEALAKGGYPFGYLIVAEDIGLLDGARSTQGTNATRGLVALLTDNALEIPMMITVGFGTDARFVVSGQERTEEKYLLDYMGFDTFEGRVTSYNSSRDTITLKGKNNVTLDVADDFDYYRVNGVTIKAWAKDDMVVVYTLKDTVKFDAVAKVDADELNLVGEDADYDVNEDAVLKLNGSTVTAANFAADYAKVVLNGDDEIIWAEGYDFDGVMLVEEIDDQIVIDLNDEELDLEDFTLVKAGRTIDVADLAKGDLVFFNDAEEFAVVYNNSEEGIIDRVYDARSFRMDGTRYSFTDITGAEMFLDGEELGLLTQVEVKQMMDEEGTVEAFLDFAGKVVLLSGDRGVAATSSYYAYVTAEPALYMKRNVSYMNLDVITAEGEEVEFDVKSTTLGAFHLGDVVKVTIEENGELDKYVVLVNPEVIDVTTASGIKVTDKYVNSKMLQSTAVVFNVENFGTDVDDIEVYTWANAAKEFTYVLEGEFYYNTSDKVIVIVAQRTDADDDTTDYFGLLTGVRKISGKDQWEITIQDSGVSYEYLTDTNITTMGAIARYDFAKIEVGEKSGKISMITEVQANPTVMNVVDVINRTEIRLSTTTTGGAIYTMVNGSVVYENKTSADKISLGTLKAGDKVEVYLDRVGSTFVKYLRLLPGDTTPTIPTVTTYTLTSKQVVDTNKTVTLGTTTYVYAGTDTQYNAAVAGTQVVVTFGELRGEVIVLTIAPAPVS